MSLIGTHRFIAVLSTNYIGHIARMMNGLAPAGMGQQVQQLDSFWRQCGSSGPPSLHMPRGAFIRKYEAGQHHST
jgi:hypothetical protein